MRLVMLVLAAVILLLSVDGVVGSKNLTDMEIRKQLIHLNKSAIKTIKSEDGDIIDCVDIYKQPAFDHPLLKNHTIQMRPSFYGSEKMSSAKPLEQLWHKSISCPEGTIPILRTRSDLPKAISLKGFGTNDLKPQMEIAKISVDDHLQGGEALIHTWNIHVEEGESSTSSIFIGKRDSSEFVNAGWIISKSLFGDDATRLYGFWASDKGSCYNLKCPGFVQVSSKTALGSAVPVSTFGGVQKAIDVKIFKDQGNSNWWLVVDKDMVGYWPKDLIKGMRDYADFIEWGGQVKNTAPGGKHTSTQMGNGHFPDEGDSAYFNSCIYYYKDFVGVTPKYNYQTNASKPSCYGISDISYTGQKTPGFTFYYGGPGGPSCDV